MTRQSLVTDLAALIVKYKPAEWSALFEAIRSSTANLDAVEAEIVRLASLPKPKRARAAKPRKRPASVEMPALPGIMDASRRAIIARITAELSTRRIMRTSGQLEEFHKNFGGSLPLPTSRQKASVAVAAQLSTLSDEDFDRAINALRPNAEQGTRSLRDDYAKWTDIISRGRDDRDKR